MKINVHMFVFIFIALITIVNDILIYFFNLNYNVSLLISFVLVLIISLVMVKKEKIKIFNNFEKKDLIFLVPYVIFVGCLMLSCDQRLDTFNYHLYTQKNFFNDKINFDRLLSCAFFFPLGDRMAYIFRYFLGYRIGMILSSYTLIVLFYQVKSILNEIYPENKGKMLTVILSGLVLLTATPNWRNTTFHIDNFSMIILFEMIYIFIRKENVFENKMNLYYLALLVGISTGIKIVNAVLGCTIVLIICLRDIKLLKNIKIKDVFLCVFLCLIPFAIYMLDNYIQTGNPIFPFFNNIFKSEYYNLSDGTDDRFGIPTVWHAFIWPVSVTLDPLLGFDYEVFREPLWGIGYIICIINSIGFLKQRNDIWKLSMLGIVLSLMWAIFMNGYTRYALVMPMLFYVIIVAMVMKVINGFDYSSIFKIIKDTIVLILLVSVLLICIMMGLYVIFIRTTEAYYGRIDFENYSVEDEVYEIDGVWATVYFNAGMIDAIREETTPIYNLDISRGINSDTSNIPKGVQNKILDELKTKRVYTVTTDVLYGEMLQCLDAYGYEIIEEYEYKNSKIQNIDNKWYILEIKSVEI